MERSSCKYYEPVFDIEIISEPDENGEQTIVGKQDIFIGEFCYKKDKYIDKDDCEGCEYYDHWVPNFGDIPF